MASILTAPPFGPLPSGRNSEAIGIFWGDRQTMENVLKAEGLLASRVNGQFLPELSAALYLQDHSSRSATMGSTRDARRAGKNAASSVAANNNALKAKKTDARSEITPKTSARAARARTRANTQPKVNPTPAKRRARSSTNCKTSFRAAPSAMR